MAGPIDFAALDAALARGETLAPAPTEQTALEQKRALSQARTRTKPGNVLDQALEAVDAERNLEGARLALRAVKAFPEAMAAYLAAAVALDRLGFLVEAISFYEEANKRAPNNASLCSLLGSTAERIGEAEIALRCYALAAKLEPRAPAHVANLGGMLRDLGRYDEAIDVLRNQLYLTPTEADLWNTLGTVCQEQGEPEQAVTFLAEAARLRPGFARAAHNLGATLTDLGRFSEGAAALDEAVAAAASHADRAEMLHARALARLGEGRLAEGWDDYDARMDPLVRDPVLFAARGARWQGEELRGKRLLLLGEQGLGDEVLFMNAVPDVLRALGPEGRLTIACEHRLVSLVSRSFPQARVIAHRTGTGASNLRKFRMAGDEAIWEEIDYWAPLAAICQRLRRSLGEFPATVGYLRADPDRVEQARAAAAAHGGLRIGIVWKSLVMSPKRRRYFAPFEAWAPLATAPNVTLFSLQYGDAAAEEAYARDAWDVALHRFDGLDLKDDLEGVAAAAMALDLVVGPMNATTNIAAACGAPTWIVHRYGSWTMHGAERAPYYPQSRAFRAPLGVWRPAFEMMARDLARGDALRAA